MSVQIVWLSTDVLIYVLLAVVAVSAVYIRKQEHLRAPWRHVVRSPSGMVGFTVLAAFVVVGLLDSVHFRPRLPAATPNAAPVYSVDVLSALDVALDALRLKREKTYSAPLATRLFAAEMTSGPDGKEVRGYPRLKYGGAHLTDPDRQWSTDVTRTSLIGIARAIVAWIALAALLAWRLARRTGIPWSDMAARLARGGTPVPWRAILITLLVMMLFAGVAATLSVNYHVLGTDKVGIDVLYEALKSVRTGLVIGTLTTLVMLPFAIALGIAAGYFRGWVDDVIQYFYTVLNSIPGVLLIAAAVLMMQVYIDRFPELFPTAAQRADLRLLFLCVILGITSWTDLCRLLRGETLKVKELDYIQAAHAFGLHHVRILSRHVLPNVMHLVLITVVMQFSTLVLAEAVLSYVGVGVDPSMNSFGTMINNARLEMAREPMVWWSLAAAFVFMVTLVLAANLFADAVRDAFDPRTRQLSPGGVKLALEGQDAVKP
jgi:peptide/nickel transport system permease protein